MGEPDPDAALHGAQPGLYKPDEQPAAAPGPLADDGTLAAGTERFPERTPTRPTQAPIEHEQSWGEWLGSGWKDFGATYQAGRAVGRADRSDFNTIMLRDGYAPIVDALGLSSGQNPVVFAEGVGAHGEPMLQSSDLLRRKGKGWLESMTDRTTQEQLIVDEIRSRRVKDPKFLAGVPDTVAGMRKYFLDNEKKKRATASETIERSSGLGAGLAQLSGGAVESMHDPINIATLPIGGGGKTAVQILARETLVNGLLEALQQPIVASNRAELGEQLGVGEAFTNIATAGIAGGIFETGLHGLGKLAKPITVPAGEAVSSAASIAAAKVRNGLAGLSARRVDVGSADLHAVFSELSNRELVDLSRSVVGHDRLTPEEIAAGVHLTRNEEIGETSPFEPGPTGDGAHEAKLAETLNDIIANNRRPDPSPLPGAGETGAGALTPEPARPPAATSTAARRPLRFAIADLPAPIVDGLKARGIPDHIARGAAAGVHAEAAANPLAVNPKSGAFGIGQWLGSRKDELFRRYGPSPTLDQQLDFLAHELKGGDPGGKSVLAARDEVEALDAYIRKFMRPAAGAETDGDLARGMAALGRGSEELPRGEFPDVGDPVDVGPDPEVARLRDEAMKLDDAVIGEPSSGLPPMYARSFKPDELTVDAARFQFKSGGDEHGVTERLRGVQEWNPMYAGRVVAWEDPDGRVFLADGHQRHGLAKRIASETGADINMDAIVLRAADGVSAEDARVYAALKNIAEGTGSPVDVAKVLRDAGGNVLEHLPPKSALVRDGAALARLSDEAFGAVYNEVIPPDFAAVIGHLLPDRPEAHGAMVDLLVKLDPANRGQAESIVRQGIAAGMHKAEQVELFGTREVMSSLMLERAKVLEKGLARLRKAKLIFNTAANEADTLERVGSKIAKSESEKEALRNAQALEIVSRLAFSRGPVADALNEAARKLAAGARLGDVVDEFTAAVRGIDLGSLSREAANDDAARLVPDGAGRGGDAAEEGENVPPQPDEQPSLIDLEAATQRFSDPHGPAVKQQADSLVHDFTAQTSRRDKIRAATAELDKARPGELRTVEPFPDEPGYHRFRYVTQDGRAVGGNYTVDGNLIEGFNIGDTHNPIDLGPAELRRVFQQLHAQHPEVQYVHGYRMSGARAKEGSGEQEIWLELTDNGAKLHREDPRPSSPVQAVEEFKKAIADEDMRHTEEDFAHLSDREVAEQLVDQVIGDAINAHAVKQGRELTLPEDGGPDDFGNPEYEALHSELVKQAMGPLAGDTEKLGKLATKAIEGGRLTLQDHGEPKLVEPQPMPPSAVVFPPADPKRSADYAGPELPPAEAAARVESWKAEAKRIGQESPPPPGTVILSLFDASGRWSQPYRDMGYEVVQLDIKHGHDIIQNLGWYVNAILDLKKRGGKIAGVIAQPPCTTFAGSGARWWDERHNRQWANAVEKMWGEWATKFFESPVEYNQWLVKSTEEMIAKAEPEFFAMENPRGRIAKLNGLPKANLELEPHHFGDPYTKNTFLYGKFNNELPTANVHPAEGSKMHKLRSSAEKDDGLRSLTPEGFAYAFALANRPGTEARPHVDAAVAADKPALDLGARADPAIADRQLQEVGLRASSPLRPGAIDAVGTGGLGLFDHHDQPTFRLEEEGGEISPADLLAELDADAKAIETLKGCL